MKYYLKYLKYKKKYLDLKGGDLPEIYDEFSRDTDYLIHNNKIQSIWDNYDEFVEIVKSFNKEIDFKNIGTESWAQDIFKKIFIRGTVLDVELNITIVDKIIIKTDNPGIIKIDDDLLLNIARPYLSPSDSSSFDEIKSNKFNLEKGGNFIPINNLSGKKFITLAIDYESVRCEYSTSICLPIYIPDFDISKSYIGDVFHIDEILCIIPTGLTHNDYEIWFYNPICDDKDYERRLKVIQEESLKILRKYYSEDKIKIFNLEFTSDGKILKPPIFNRIVLRTNNKFCLIFPEQDDNTPISSRLEEIKSTGVDIEYHFIDTEQLHKQNGNIHCAFKSFPKLS